MTMQPIAERNCPHCGSMMETGPHPERRVYDPAPDEPPYFTCPSCGEWRAIPYHSTDEQKEAERQAIITRALAKLTAEERDALGHGKG